MPRLYWRSMYKVATIGNWVFLSLGQNSPVMELHESRSVCTHNSTCSEPVLIKQPSVNAFGFLSRFVYIENALALQSWVFRYINYSSWTLITILAVYTSLVTSVKVSSSDGRSCSTLLMKDISVLKYSRQHPRVFWKIHQSYASLSAWGQSAGLSLAMTLYQPSFSISKDYWLSMGWGLSACDLPLFIILFIPTLLQWQFHDHNGIEDSSDQERW